MLNFREELNKLKEEKLKSDDRTQEAVEKYLQGVLHHFKTKRLYDFCQDKEFMFAFAGNAIYVKEDPRGTEMEVCRLTVADSEMALKVLILTEQKLESEGFKISSNERAEKNGKFGVIINV